MIRIIAVTVRLPRNNNHGMKTEKMVNQPKKTAATDLHPSLGWQLSSTAKKAPARRARASSRVAEGLMLGACPTFGHPVELFRHPSYAKRSADSKMKGSELERP
jgi:hypothetical protein